MHVNSQPSAMRDQLNKVPQVTFLFWIIKMMSTTVGETFADYLAFDRGIGMPMTALLTGILLVGVLVWQMRARTYIPLVYWLVVVLLSVFGTLVTDLLTDVANVPLLASTAVFSVLLATAFLVWYKQERTLSIHHIDTPKREAYYWVAIFLTFALGTAVGDWIAESIGLGYFASAILFASLIAMVAIGRYVFGLNSVVSFWCAYVLTRPLGASCGDLLAQSTANGGIGLGTTVVSALFLAVIILLVGSLTLSQGRIAKGS